MRTYISNAELEELGTGIVYGYTKGNKKDLECVDIEGMIADYLCLPIIYVSFEDAQKIGFLADGLTPLHIVEENIMETVIYPAGSIVLERKLLLPNETGRRRFTLAHEAAHWILNRHHPSGQYSPAGNNKENDQEETCESTVESQADRLAAVLLMPQYTVQNAVRLYTGRDRMKVYGNMVFAPEEKFAMRKIAEHIGVSYSALFYRLKELELFEIHDIQEYIHEDLQLGVRL